MAIFQKTLKGECVFEGRGLHLGLPVKMTLCPAPANTGLVFVVREEGRRVEIPVISRNYERKSLRTALCCDGHGVETVEHVLSAAYGLGVTNLVIEMDNIEPPACDGSAKQMAEKMLEVGLEEQSERRKILKVSKAISVQLEDGSSIVALPSSGGLKISYTLAGQGLPDQFVEYEHSAENFLRSVAPARTFCRDFEIELLKSMPEVGCGATEENTLVVQKEKMPEFRVPNELAAHKVLDLLGDLAALGADVQGHIICHKTGHHANQQLIKELEKGFSGQFMDITQIMEVLPHSYPFLLVDRIVEFDEGRRVVGIKNVTINEPFFTGHFPSEPIMPGVLMIEALAQTGAVFLYKNRYSEKNRLVMLTGVDKVKFRNRVVPGDQLELEVLARNLKSTMGVVKGVARVNGELACECELKFMIVSREK